MTYEEAEAILGQLPHSYFLVNLQIDDLLIHVAELIQVYIEDYGGDDVLLWEALTEACFYTWTTQTPDQIHRDDLIEVYTTYLSFGQEYLENFVTAGMMFFERLTHTYRALLPELQQHGVTTYRVWAKPPHANYASLYVVIECIPTHFPRHHELIEQGYLATCTWSRSPSTLSPPTPSLAGSYTPGYWS